MNHYEWEDFRNAQLERFGIDFTTYYIFSCIIKTIYSIVMFILPFLFLLSVFGFGMYHEVVYGAGRDPLSCKLSTDHINFFRMLHIWLFH